MSACRTLAALSWLMLLVTRGGAVSRCEGRACSPPIGNLATGRTLHTLSGCCGGSSHPHGLCPHPPLMPHLCPKNTHPPHHMADDPFLRPETWWEPDGGTAAWAKYDEIRLDLETKFCLSYVVLVFRSPRPAAMAIERSVDHGATWEPLKLFAQNCSAEFGLPDDFSQPGSLCSSRYTSATPCRGGEVILRTLDPGAADTPDPYSPEGLTRLTLTNLRIRLLKAQACPGSTSPPGAGPHPTDTAPPSLPAAENSASPYAISTLLARGTCLCHGHAELCVPANSSPDTAHSNVVSGRCLCAHHTAGNHCETCAPLYNDRPWRPANGSSGEPNPCQKCECHGHADSCHFSLKAWLSSGGTSGGVCDDCRHNTAGRRCHRCRHGYRRNPSLLPNSPHSCSRCWCDPQGSLPTRLLLPGEEGPWCHPRSGRCQCKPGVGGPSCGRCLPGYWGFGDEGCQHCACPHSCDPATGRCLDSYTNNQVFNVPIGGKVPDLDMFPVEENVKWFKELAISSQHYTGQCSCKEKRPRSVADLCKTKYDYVIRASVLSAHDKGSHAEVLVKVHRILRSGRAALYLGSISIYPLSWTSRGCTCPILNPGKQYLLAGTEEAGTGRLLVTMQSLVVPWTPRLGLLLEGLRSRCLWSKG